MIITQCKCTVQSHQAQNPCISVEGLQNPAAWHTLQEVCAFFLGVCVVHPLNKNQCGHDILP